MGVTTLLSVQVGTVKTYPLPGGKEWQSAIVKTPVTGPVWLGITGLAGDEQAYKAGHGGPHMAVNVYPSEHFAHWRTLPGLEGITGGGWGENFTTQGITEDTVCLGDVFRVGEVIVEVSQPRQPCAKLDRRWDIPGLHQQAEDSGRVGWYFRVKQEGRVWGGSELTLLERPFPQWTIARVYALRSGQDVDGLHALVDCPALSPGWRKAMLARIGS